MVYADGRILEGEYSQTSTFFTRLINVDGTYYIGTRYRMKNEGNGTLYDPDGNVLQRGVWKAGELIREQKESLSFN